MGSAARPTAARHPEPHVTLTTDAPGTVTDAAGRAARRWPPCRGRRLLPPPRPGRRPAGAGHPGAHHHLDHPGGVAGVPGHGPRFFTSERWAPNDNEFGALAFIYGTLVVSVIALVARGAGQPRDRPVPHRGGPQAAAPAGRLRARPAGRHPLGGVRPLGPSTCCGSRWGTPSTRRSPRPTELDPRPQDALRRAGQRAQLLHRRDDPGPDDHADHHLASAARCSTPCPTRSGRGRWPWAPPAGR